jgi:hypothetical protein
MKTYLTAGILLASLSVLTIGCGSDREVVKKEVSDEPRLLGGRKYEENTTYRNSDGSYSTEKKQVKTP